MELDAEKPFETPRWRYIDFSGDYDDEKNIYLETNKIIYKILFVVGFMPLTYKKEGHVERVYWRLLSFESVYSVVILSISVYFNIILTLNNVKRIEHAKKFNDIFTAVFNVFTIAPVIAKILSFSLDMKRAQAFIEDWHELQIRYRKVTGRNFRSTLRGVERKIYVTYFVCFFIPLLLLTELRFYNSITWWIVIEQIAYTYNALVGWQLAGFWFINICCLHQILKDLKLEINKRLLKESKTTAKNTDDLRSIWLRLSDIIRQLGSVFVFTLITRIFVMSTIFIISLYFGLAPSGIAENRNFDDAFRHYAKIFILFGLLLFYFNTGHSIRKRASADFQFQLLSIQPTKEQRMAGFEIKVFLHSLTSYSPTVNLSGFFTINRKTFLTILSTAVTNLLILEQFKLSETHAQASKHRTQDNAPD